MSNQPLASQLLDTSYYFLEPNRTQITDNSENTFHSLLLLPSESSAEPIRQAIQARQVEALTQPTDMSAVEQALEKTEMPTIKTSHDSNDSIFFKACQAQSLDAVKSVCESSRFDSLGSGTEAIKPMLNFNARHNYLDTDGGETGLMYVLSRSRGKEGVPNAQEKEACYSIAEYLINKHKNKHNLMLTNSDNKTIIDMLMEGHHYMSSDKKKTLIKLLLIKSTEPQVGCKEYDLNYINGDQGSLLSRAAVNMQVRKGIFQCFLTEKPHLKLIYTSLDPGGTILHYMIYTYSKNSNPTAQTRMLAKFKCLVDTIDTLTDFISINNTMEASVSIKDEDLRNHKTIITYANFHKGNNLSCQKIFDVIQNTFIRLMAPHLIGTHLSKSESAKELAYIIINFKPTDLECMFANNFFSDNLKRIILRQQQLEPLVLGVPSTPLDATNTNIDSVVAESDSSNQDKKVSLLVESSIPVSFEEQQDRLEHYCRGDLPFIPAFNIEISSLEASPRVNTKRQGTDDLTDPLCKAKRLKVGPSSGSSSTETSVEPMHTQVDIHRSQSSGVTEEDNLLESTKIYPDIPHNEIDKILQEMLCNTAHL